MATCRCCFQLSSNQQHANTDSCGKLELSHNTITRKRVGKCRETQRVFEDDHKCSSLRRRPHRTSSKQSLLLEKKYVLIWQNTVYSLYSVWLRMPCNILIKEDKQALATILPTVSPITVLQCLCKISNTTEKAAICSQYDWLIWLLQDKANHRVVRVEMHSMLSVLRLLRIGYLPTWCTRSRPRLLAMPATGPRIPPPKGGGLDWPLWAPATFCVMSHQWGQLRITVIIQTSSDDT